MRLYHGSDQAICAPQVAFNTGFSDLGQGFYLTDDASVARSRAKARARKTGQREGVVSVFELDEGCVAWATWGSRGLRVEPGVTAGIFGLRFAEPPEGIVSWVNYIKACRSGHTEVPGLGSPAIVRAWIATEEVEMACSGFVDAADLEGYFSADELVVQYCLLDQELIDQRLVFVEAQSVS